MTSPFRSAARRLSAAPAPGPRTPRASYDVVVVGGSVRALAIARACARDGATVGLFAPGEIAGAPDERAWPVVRAAHVDRFRMAADARAPKRMSRFTTRSALQGARDRTGCLSLALWPEDVASLSDAAERAKASGVEAWMVPPLEVAALSPPLGAGAIAAAALYEPGAATVDADAVALALVAASSSAGAELFAARPASALLRSADGTATGVRFETGEVGGDAVVLADDVSAIRLVREGKGRLSLKREERQFIALEAGGPSIGPALAIDDVTLARSIAGEIVASGPYGLDMLARRLVAMAPSLAGLAVVSEEPATIWTGVDGLAQVGKAEIPHLWLALGFGRDALSGALPAAKHIAAALAGKRHDPAFEPLAPTRGPHPRREPAH